MTTGSTEYVLVCRPLPDGDQATNTDMQLYPPVGAQHFQIRTMQALLEPSSLQASRDSVSIDAEYAGALWAIGFSTVVGLYLLSAHAGAVLNLIRR